MHINDVTRYEVLDGIANAGLTGWLSVDSLVDHDLIIGAVFENFEVKRGPFPRLGGNCEIEKRYAQGLVA